MSKRSVFTYLIYIDEKPFCFLSGSEQDAKDFVANKSNATYEPMVTVMVQHGLEHGED